jgi:DNA-binding helix-hairpin-helix protein with protein kinase domain
MIAASVLGGFPGPIPLLLFIGAVIAFFTILNVLDKSEDLRTFGDVHSRASATWQQMQQEWQSKAGAQRFDQKKRQLIEIRRELDELPKLRLKKHDDLKRNQRAIQLTAFLDQFEIQHTKISGIGAGRKQTLESYGIETAADLNPAAIDKVPGFGPKMQSNLMAWRLALESRFKFDPNKRIDPREINRVEQEILLERRRLELRLRTEFAELRQTHAQVLATRQHMKAQVIAIYTTYLQAAADYKAAQSAS